MNTALIEMAQKAADAWKDTQGYEQASIIINALIAEVKRLDKDAN